MFVNNMPLKAMINFAPNDEDMAMLPLDVVVWIRMSFIGIEKAVNYNAIRYFFTNEDFKALFKDIDKTVFYDFDATKTKQNCFVTICELYGLNKDTVTLDTVKEIMEEYDHSADIIFDVFTHDNKKYRLSNLDGIVKNELMG